VSYVDVQVSTCELCWCHECQHVSYVDIRVSTCELCWCSSVNMWVMLMFECQHVSYVEVPMSTSDSHTSHYSSNTHHCHRPTYTLLKPWVWVTVQVACHQLLTTESWVRSQCSVCGICVRRSGREIAFTPSCFFPFFNSYLPNAPYSSLFHIVQVLTVSLNKLTNKLYGELHKLTLPQIVTQVPTLHATQHILFVLLCVYNLHFLLLVACNIKSCVWARQCCSGPELVSTMAVTTVVLALALVMVMAEEFHQLPEILQAMSSVLMLHRNRRTAFICCVIVLMSAASSVTLVVSSGSEVWSHCLVRENLVLYRWYRSSYTHC
jgi:hypothetical protein